MSAADVRAAVENAFRDYETNGVPSSGPHEPSKADIRYALGVLLQTAIESAGAGLTSYPTIAARNADTSKPAGTLGYVYRNNGSTTDAANGFYQWTGSAWESASWLDSLIENKAVAAITGKGFAAGPIGQRGPTPFQTYENGFHWFVTDTSPPRLTAWFTPGNADFNGNVTDTYRWVGYLTPAEVKNLAIGFTNFLPQANVKGYGEYDSLVDDLAKLDAGTFAPRISDFRARALTSVSPLAVALDWDADGAVSGFVLSWGNGYSVPLGGGVRSFRPPLWSAQTRVTSIGDSMMEGKWVEGAAAALGLAVNNVAKYSSGAYQPYRLGTRELRFTVTGNSIPASGTGVSITAINGGPPSFDAADDAFSGRRFLNTFPGDTIATNCSVSGWLGGRHGVVSVPNGGTVAYTFTPDDGVTSASALTAQSLFVPDNLARLATDELWIRMSQNYFYADYTPAFPNNINPRVLDDIQAIVDRARGQRIIILALTPGNDFLPGTKIYDALRYFNNQLRVRWPQYAAYLTGVTYSGSSFTGNNMDFIRAYGSDGSANDVADIANGLLPRSCMASTSGSEVHLNAKGQALESTFLQLYRAAQAVPPAIAANTLFTLAATATNPRTGVTTSVTASTSVQTGQEAAWSAAALTTAEINAADADAANPNLYGDPEFENLTVGGVQAWNGANLAVVSTGGAKRLRTPSSASALAVIDATARRVSTANIPNNRVSVSIVIARKDATSAPSDLRVRLLAFDAAGNGLNWPDLSTSDETANALYYGRNVPSAASTVPYELVVARNVQLPANCASIALMFRVQTTGTMDFSHITVRNGANPHYRPTQFSQKAFNDLSAGVAQLSGQAAAAYAPNLYGDPEFENLTVGGSQSWSGISLSVVSQGGAKRLRTPAASGSAIGAIDDPTRAVSATLLPTGRVSASVIIARKDASALGSDLRFRLIAYDSGGTQLNWPDVSKSDEPGGTSYYSRYAPVGAITVPTELVIAENVALPAGTATVRAMVRIDSTPTMDFSHLAIRDGADPHYRATRVTPKMIADGAAAPQAYAEASEVGLGLVTSQPNLFTQAQLDFTDTAVSGKSAGMTVSAASFLGVPVLSLSSAVSATNWANWQFNRAAALGSAAVFSASICVMGLDANSAGACRVLARQLNSSGSEITAARVVMQVSTDGSAITGPRHYRAANITLDAACTDVQLYVEVTAGTSGARAVYVRDMLLAAGGSAAFRRPPVTAASLGIGAVPPEDFADISAAFPNRFTSAELDVQSMRYAVGNANSLVASTYGTDRRPAWSFTRAAGLTEGGVYFGNIPRADLDNGSGFFSAALQVYSQDAYVGASGGQNARFLVIQRDSTNTEISGTRVTLNSTTGGVASPTWFRQAGIALHANTVSVMIYVGIANGGGTADRSVKFGDMLLAPGSNATFRRPATTGGSGGGVLVISPTGSDSNVGSVASPMATAQAALNKMGGSGTIIALFGTYTAAQMQISPATVTGKLKIIGRRSASTTGYDNYPVLYCASKLTGITKTSGRTKIYQTVLAAPPTNANFNWAYQDGVADPRTVIAADERSPQHRGRTNRLHWGTKLVKTTATTLAAALDEIDAADNNDPRAFIDDATGTLYFSIVGGGDGSAANIYMDAANGLFTSSGSTRETAPELEILGLEVRYGGVDTSFFRRAHVDELFVFGSATNCVYYSVLSYGTLECAAAGSQAGLTGDGLNGHIGAKIVSGSDYYGHDCRDDGYSDHEGSSSRMHGGLLEYNGGTGAAPAYGADDVLRGFTSRKNQQRGTYKKAGFYVTGAPSAGASGGDGGLDTLAVFRDCISIGDIVGFADDRASTSNAVRAVCINCKVYDQTGAHGYDVAEIRDCGWSSGTGIMRRLDGGATVVKNTGVVT